MERSQTYILRLKTIHRLSPYHAYREPHKMVPLAADGVDNISERPCRHQIVGRFGVGAVERVALRHL